MRDSAHGQQSSFSYWLRTGRLPDPDASAAIERKFNPWHDPEDGRFTFAGQGRHYGSGGGGSSTAAKPRRRGGISTGAGSFGGAGASGSFGKPSPAKPNVKPKPTSRGVRNFPGWLPATPAPWPKPPAKPAPARPVRTPPLRPVERNGYTYHLDEKGDPRKINVPKLATHPETPRSRSAQANAGKPDRLPTDDGGHFIAHRFNGPNDAFNHFAQDRSSNRGRYRVVEQEWADAQKGGKDVSLKMEIEYPKGSRRPDFIEIWYNIEGKEKHVKIDNRPGMSPPKSRGNRRK
jgi:hypothetical protein